MTITETNRLILRGLIPQDAFHFFEMNKDPEVMEYTGDDAFSSLEEANKFIANYDQYQRYGMGRWAVIRKADNEFLGWCGLKFHPKENVVEVGYRFYKKYWGYGYATEAAKASINYGFSTLKLTKIYAHAHIDNIASLQVLRKCGMSFHSEGIYDNMPAVLYVKKNPAIKIKLVPSVETYMVRHPVLREGKPMDSCRFDDDDLPTTFHLGVFFDKKLVGVVSLLENRNSLFKGKGQFQLRGMAVLQDFQKKGIGELLVKEAEMEVRSRKGDFIWMNARVAAVRFYKKLGYGVFGEEFEIPNVGPHYKMIKNLG